MEIQKANYKSQNNSQNDKNQKQNGKIYDIRQRILAFAIEIVGVCRQLPKTLEYEQIRKQLIRSATSIGANYEEADGTLTKKDFLHKAAIARKEAKETRYWLMILQSTQAPTKEMADYLQEVEEIISILSAIIIKCGGKTYRS
jgi:four helix bundle protein